MLLIVIISVTAGTPNAWALNCESTGTGFWDQSSTWSNCSGGVPADGDNVTIKNGHTVTIRTDILTVALVGLSLTVEQSAELVLDGASGGMLRITVGTFTNFGKTTLAGVGGATNGGELRLGATPGTNECGGTIDANGGSNLNTGLFIVSNAVFVNKGTINLNGGGGTNAGSLVTVNAGGQVDNHGTINENPGAGTNSGIVLVISGFFNDNLPNLCPIVGGELLPIDSTALMLAGLQSSAIWMLPILAGAAGIGAYYIKTRMNKDN